MAKVPQTSQRTGLKILTLATNDLSEPTTPEFSSTGSWQGFAVAENRKMERLSRARWADIEDSSLLSSETPSDAARRGPAFPTSEFTSAAAATSEGEVSEERIAAEGPMNQQPEEQRDSHSSVAAPKDVVVPTSEVEEVAPFEPEGEPGFVSLPKANFELEGWLPFIPYGREATETELPSAASMEAEVRNSRGAVVRKLFFGHLPSALPTGVLQWLVDVLVPTKAGDVRPLVFEPQLHFKDGWFRGCAHAFVLARNTEEVLAALHHRVLFDLHGIWYARTPSEAQSLQQYCLMLRNLPQRQRHEKLHGLPCNPLACELTKNA